MKITILRKITPFFFLVFSAVVFTQCQTDEVSINNDFIGTWYQTARSINDNATTKDSTRLLMQVNENFICILCDSSAVAKRNNAIVKRSGWSFSDNYLNLAIDLPASWKVTVANSSLTMEKVDFSGYSIVQKTTLQFTKSTAIPF